MYPSCVVYLECTNADTSEKVNIASGNKSQLSS